MADADYSEGYLRAWGKIFDISDDFRTRRFNAGLFWVRNKSDPRQLASEMFRVRPEGLVPLDWEQGFFAAKWAQEDVAELPTQRYFYPIFDGLPGGMSGYDYRTNPCGFASIHFGGLGVKPSDHLALVLAQDILGRRLGDPGT
jgi:hypothetical protein